MRRRGAWVLAAALVIALLTVQRAAADIEELGDPSFESGAGWSFSADVARVASHPHSGTYSVYWNGTDSGSASRDVTIPPGVVYFGCYVSDGNGHTWTFSLTRHSDNFTRSFTHAGNAGGGAMWWQYTSTMTDGANDAWTFAVSYATDWGYADDCTVHLYQPTPTPTNTPTNTPTLTNTPIPTLTPSLTPLATYTPFPVLTALPTFTGVPSLTPLPLPGVWYPFVTKMAEVRATRSVPGNGPIDTGGIGLTFQQIGNQVGLFLVLPWLLTALGFVLAVALVTEFTVGLKRAYYALFVGEENSDETGEDR